MKLLFITRKIDKQDGAASFTYYWVSSFAKKVSTLHVICLEKGDATGLPENVYVHSMGKEKGKNRFKEFFTYCFLLFKFIPKVDGVLSHQNPEYGIIAAPFARIFRKKIVAWYAHGTINPRARMLHTLVNKVATSSAAGFTIESNKRVILHQGIDTERFYYLHELTEKSRFITVGRVSKSKRIELILDALKQIRDNGIDAKLDIVGGPVKDSEKRYFEQLQHKVEELGLREYVTFHGPTPYEQLPGLLSKASVFVNTSVTGSLDKAVLEAMSMGIPVAVTNPAYSFLSDIDTRFFLEDDTNLATSLESLVRDRPKVELRERLRNEVVQKHSIDSLVTDILKLYDA